MRNAIVWVVLAIVSAVASVALADEAPKSALQEAIDALPTVKASVTVKSNYVTANGYASGRAIQEDLNLSWKSGFYGDVWLSSGTNDRKLSSDFADELDLTVGYAGKTEFAGREVGFDVGVSYFDLYSLTKWRGDILDPYAVLSAKFELDPGTLTPEFKVENLISTTDWRSRPQVTASLNYAVDLGWQGAEFSTTAKAVYDFGTAEADAGVILRWRAGIDIPLVEDKSLVLGISYERYWMGGTIHDREDVGSFALSISCKF